LIDLNVIKLKENSPITRNLRLDRVYIFYDNDGNEKKNDIFFKPQHDHTEGLEALF